MNINPLFSSYVAQDDLDIDNAKLEKYCRKVREIDAGRQVSNQGGWQSELIFKIEEEEFLIINTKELTIIDSKEKTLNFVSKKKIHFEKVNVIMYDYDTNDLKIHKKIMSLIYNKYPTINPWTIQPIVPHILTKENSFSEFFI
jgi:hypothetical protein